MQEKLTSDLLQGQVGARYGVSESVISRLWNRYQETGDVKDRSGKGRKSNTDHLRDRFTVNQALKRRTMTATKLRASLSM